MNPKYPLNAKVSQNAFSFADNPVAINARKEFGMKKIPVISLINFFSCHPYWILITLVFTSSFFLPNCAKIGTITGGPKDTIPPLVLSCEPPLKATGIKPKKIVITFNEFLDLKNIQQELLVSPPLNKQPQVKLKGKKIEIIIEDTLKENTSYTLNFGNAITDYTENNPVRDFIYVFSTGSYVDSFRLTGTVISAYDLKIPKEQVLVMLYDQLSDSAPYRVKPLYAGRTAKDGSFSIPFLKGGTFRAVAITDANGNLKYDPPDEMIGFDDSFLVLHPDSFKIHLSAPDTTIVFNPADSIDFLKNRSDTQQISERKEYAATIHFRLFKEQPSRQYLKDFKRPEAPLLAIYLAIPSQDTVLLELADTTINQPWYIPEMSQNLDTFLFWLTDSALIQKQTLRVVAHFPETDSAGKIITRTDTFRFAFAPKTQARQRKGEEHQVSSGFKLTVNMAAGKIMELNQSFLLEIPHPVSEADTSRIAVEILSDTIFQPCHFTLRKNTSQYFRKVFIDVPWEENATYKVTCLPGAWKTIYGQTNDTLQVRFKSREADYYGNLIIATQHASTPVVYELLENEKVISTKKADTMGKTTFDLLLPKKYKVRAIADENANGQWDTGNYLKKIQPEKVVIYPAEVEIRSNWDLEISVDMAEAR